MDNAKKFLNWLENNISLLDWFRDANDGDMYATVKNVKIRISIQGNGFIQAYKEGTYLMPSIISSDYPIVKALYTKAYESFVENANNIYWGDICKSLDIK